MRNWFRDSNPFLEYDTIIHQLHEGDLIEIDRGKYRHWALCESKQNKNVLCFHVSKTPDFETKRENIPKIEACIRYESLINVLLNEGKEMSKCRVNNQSSKAEELMKKEEIKSPPDINGIINELHEIAETIHTVEYDPKV
jgi:hypothetical protein